MLAFTSVVEVILYIWAWIFHFFITNYMNFIDEINKSLAKDLGLRFELVYPQLVLTVKWKFDYIICRKIKKRKKFWAAINWCIGIKMEKRFTWNGILGPGILCL